MSFAEDARRGLGAAWRLIQLDRDALAAFDRSDAGFWRSFLAAAIVAPLHIAGAMGKQPLDSDDFVWWLAQGVNYVVLWVAFPVASHFLAHMVGRIERWRDYVIAYNWLAVLLAATMIPGLLIEDGQQAGAFTIASGIVIVGVTLFYLHFLARNALVITHSQAALFVTVDVVLSLIITSLGDALTK